MGTTGYWVRARVDLTSGTITGTVQQQNREVYSITWSHIQVDEGQVPGDVPAFCRIKLYNESSGAGYGVNPILFANRVILGLRSDSRGENFRAYLNFAEEQNPNGISITVDPDFSEFQADSTAPTGRSVFYEPDSTGEVGMETRAIVEFQGRNITQEYAGRYHAWVRCKVVDTVASGTSMTVRLAKSMPGGDPVVISEERTISQLNVQRALDMGEVVLPVSGLPISILADSWFGDKLYVQAQGSGVVGDWDASDGLVLYDLILIPIDEWAGEFLDPSDFNDFLSTLGQSEWGNQRFLDADSISSPKSYITGTIQNQPGVVAYGTTRWIERTNGELIAKANADQRLFLFAEQFPVYDTTSYFYNKPYQGYSVQMFRNARYLGMRGDR
jgi:hypothetical protein